MKKIIPAKGDLEAIKEATAAHASAHYHLRLFVVGATPHSNRAIVNTRKICEDHLHGRYDLEVVDISKNPAMAKLEQILAAPTLIKKLPLPLRRFIGDMSQTERIVRGLDLEGSHVTHTEPKRPPTG